MKAIVLIFILALTACGPNSSPEKRMNQKVEGVQQQLDDLKKQNASILDSLGKMSAELKRLNEKK